MDGTDADTDDDTMPDGWEVEYGLDPLYDDRYEDPDEDEQIFLGEKGPKVITDGS